MPCSPKRCLNLLFLLNKLPEKDTPVLPTVQMPFLGWIRAVGDFLKL